VNEPLLQVRNVSKFFGGFAALTSVDLDVYPGERLGLIGPNGSGKTTLIHCVSGLLTVDKGSIHFLGRDITRIPAYRRARAGICRSFQIPKPFHSMTVLENLCIPLEYAARSAKHGADLEAEARSILELIGLAEKAHTHPLELTQIGMRKLELARALAGNPKLLILDEVMAGLANSEVDEILSILRGLNDQGITIIMIEHILRAVMSFSKRLVVLDAGQKIAEGEPAAIMNNREVEKAYLGE
jgi:branched-chain amino acid transport system ATP-binding protein